MGDNARRIKKPPFDGGPMKLLFLEYSDCLHFVKIPTLGRADFLDGCTYASRKLFLNFFRLGIGHLLAFLNALGDVEHE